MHKAGFVNIVGNPNVGKSTLMNLLVGERISITTFKAQTTRHRIMGILNTPEMQICFSDTPGVLKPNYKLQEHMLKFSESALQDADVLLYVTDMVETPDKNADFLEKVQKLKVPILVLVNKIDLGDQEGLAKKVEEWHAVMPQAEIIPISALHRFNVDVVLRRIQELLPESPAYFDKDIPYSVEVRVELFKEDERKIHISAIIYVERESQKGIIIGHQGVALKKVGTEARKALEKFFDKPIYLQLFVKVDKDWRSSQRELNSFGYNPE